MGQIEKLEKDIRRLEERLNKDHFGGLVNKTGRIKDEKKLAKLRKELDQLKKNK
jgi:predicted  nucleic acid-binding Zn-ribbon protein